MITDDQIFFALIALLVATILATSLERQLYV